eukprot:scaffold24634_cov63-Phaeocystis_antarctica.AAC.4
MTAPHHLTNHRLTNHRLTNHRLTSLARSFCTSRRVPGRAIAPDYQRLWRGELAACDLPRE